MAAFNFVMMKGVGGACHHGDTERAKKNCALGPVLSKFLRALRISLVTENKEARFMPKISHGKVSSFQSSND